MKSKIFLLLFSTICFALCSCNSLSESKNNSGSSTLSSSAVSSFSVAQEDFYFALTWGVQKDSSYDSRTGTLIKTKYVRERQPEEYITTYSGLNSMEQAKYMKRLFYEYKAQYFVMDTKGVGNTVFDILTNELYQKNK